jgi:nucleoside-diphosphate-sugar epimerase
MKIAVTGCNGRVGSRVSLFAVKEGHSVLGIDISPGSDIAASKFPEFSYKSVDLSSYPNTLEALRGCDAVIHLAGQPNPTDYEVKTHNTYV